MAHRPFKYGTVIRPTITNHGVPRTARQMVVGLSPATPGLVVAIDLDPDSEYLGVLYEHLTENMHELWEAVEEVPD